jgi:hypothetical protein
MLSEFKNRIELLSMTGVASVGMYLCKQAHNWCGHVQHSSHVRIESLAFDSIWIFALSGVAVVGIRGRFRGARPIGIVCAFIIAVMALTQSTLDLLGAIVLAILVLVQLVELLLYLIRNVSKES